MQVGRRLGGQTEPPNPRLVRMEIEYLSCCRYSFARLLWEARLRGSLFRCFQHELHKHTWVMLGNVSGRRSADRTVMTCVSGPEGHLVTWALSSKAAAVLALGLVPQPCS